MAEEYPLIINQTVAILVDGNNIEMALKDMVGDRNALVDFDSLVPKLLDGRGLNKLIYFREGVSISDKLAERLLDFYHGSVVPCHKSADIPLTIKATQIARKVDTIIILSGDSDYIELVRHLKGEGVRVEIAAVENSMSKMLKEEVERFIPITKDDSYILRSYKKPRTKSTRSSRSKKSSSKKGQKKS